VSTEPKRLRLGADALSASIASVQQALPSAERMAALAERLARAGAPVDAPAPPAPASAPRPSLRVVHAAKVFGPGTLAVLAALVFGGGLIGAAHLLSKPDLPLQPPASPPLATPTVATLAPETSTPPARASGDTPLVRAPRAAESVSVSPVSPVPPAPLGSAVPAPSVEPRRETEAATSAAATASPLPSAPPAMRDEASALAPSARPKPAPVDASPQGAPLAANTAVVTEVELLKQARSALGGDPLQAFALSERCRAQYPNGAFAQEREYIAISALVRLGLTDEARSRASLFRMHYPSSAYLPRLARMLGE